MPQLRETFTIEDVKALNAYVQSEVERLAGNDYFWTARNKKELEDWKTQIEHGKQLFDGGYMLAYSPHFAYGLTYTTPAELDAVRLSPHWFVSAGHVANSAQECVMFIVLKSDIHAVTSARYGNSMHAINQASSRSSISDE